MSKYKNYDERFTFEGAGGSGTKVLEVYLKPFQSGTGPVTSLLYANADYTEFLKVEDVEDVYNTRGYLLVKAPKVIASDEANIESMQRVIITDINKTYSTDDVLIVVGITGYSGSNSGGFKPFVIPNENTPMPEDSGDGQIINNPGDKGGSGTIITEG